jgi:8-oxo-dGTP diphosphatase
MDNSKFELHGNWEVARVQVLAAGGIVLRRELPPRVAVVRLRKRDEWVLPKGKLDDGETPRAAAKREVLEETGHNVTVREFLGTLVYESGGRAKVVHYWSMEANGEPIRALMSDIRAVDWLPLNAAVQRLSRDHERVFLETVGPLAISAHARRLKAKAAVAREPAVAAPAARKGRPAVVVPEAVPIVPLSSEPAPQVMTPLAPETCERTLASSETPAIEPFTESDAARMGVEPGGETDATETTDPADNRRRSFSQRLREWLGRAS